MNTSFVFKSLFLSLLPCAFMGLNAEFRIVNNTKYPILIKYSEPNKQSLGIVKINPNAYWKDSPGDGPTALSVAKDAKNAKWTSLNVNNIYRVMSRSKSDIPLWMIEPKSGVFGGYDVRLEWDRGGGNFK